MKDKFNWRNHIRDIYITAAIVSLGMGAVVAFIGNSTGNPLVIMIGFAGLAGGFMLFLAWRRMGDIRYTGESKGKEGKGYNPPNSLNIYRDKVVFEYVEALLGQSQKCYNDGKYYHVHIMDQDTDKLKELSLPDDDESERYYDPGEFANPVTMPSNKKYFTWSASTMQKISVGIMALVIAGMIFGLVAIGG